MSGLNGVFRSPSPSDFFVRDVSSASSLAPTPTPTPRVIGLVDMRCPCGSMFFSNREKLQPTAQGIRAFYDFSAAARPNCLPLSINPKDLDIFNVEHLLAYLKYVVSHCDPAVLSEIATWNDEKVTLAFRNLSQFDHAAHDEKIRGAGGDEIKIAAINLAARTMLLRGLVFPLPSHCFLYFKDFVLTPGYVDGEVGRPLRQVPSGERMNEADKAAIASGTATTCTTQYNPGLFILLQFIFTLAPSRVNYAHNNVRTLLCAFGFPQFVVDLFSHNNCQTRMNDLLRMLELVRLQIANSNDVADRGLANLLKLDGGDLMQPHAMVDSKEIANSVTRVGLELQPVAGPYDSGMSGLRTLLPAYFLSKVLSAQQFIEQHAPQAPRGDEYYDPLEMYINPVSSRCAGAPPVVSRSSFFDLSLYLPVRED